MTNRGSISHSKDTVHRSLKTPDFYFHQLVDAVSDYAVFLLDSRGAITSWNRGAEKINGYSAAAAATDRRPPTRRSRVGIDPPQRAPYFTGNEQIMFVPIFGLDSKLKVPPISATRYFIVRRPRPFGFLVTENPSPLSEILRTPWSSSTDSATSIFFAWPRLAALLIASWVIR